KVRAGCLCVLQAKARATLKPARGSWSCAWGSLHLELISTLEEVRAMLHRVLVGDNERVLVIRKKRFAEILGPGEYWIFALDVQLERYNIRGLVFASEWADTIVNTRAVMAAEFFTVVETLDAQVAVVYLDGKLARVLMP